jgi:hypothetical protein
MQYHSNLFLPPVFNSTAGQARAQEANPLEQLRTTSRLCASRCVETSTPPLPTCDTRIPALCIFHSFVHRHHARSLFVLLLEARFLLVPPNLRRLHSATTRAPRVSLRPESPINAYNSRPRGPHLPEVYTIALRPPYGDAFKPWRAVHLGPICPSTRRPRCPPWRTTSSRTYVRPVYNLRVLS